MIEILKKSGGTIPYASWDQWSPADYLKTYFTNLGPDSYETLKFLSRELKKIKDKPKQKILDFGSGPTIFSAMAAAPYASEIHLADYLEGNLDELKKWLNNEDKCFDWSHCIKYVLELEGIDPTPEAIKFRETLIKLKSSKLMRCDASLPNPLGIHEKYPLVITTFCADSATSSKDVWNIYMKNILNLIKPGGALLLSALRNCTAYKNGGFSFPCANINENDLKEILFNNGILKNNLSIEVCSVPECESEGFTSIMFASAQKGASLTAKKILIDQESIKNRR